MRLPQRRRFDDGDAAYRCAPGFSQRALNMNYVSGLRIVSFLCCLRLCSIGYAADGAVGVWQNRLREEAVPSWLRMKSWLRNEISVEVKLWRFSLQGHDPVDAIDLVVPEDALEIPQIHREFLLSKFGDRVDSTKLSRNKNVETVQARNSRYSFEAAKKEGHGWMATEVKHGTTSQASRFGEGPYMNDLLRAYKTVSLPLEELVLHPSFIVTNVEPIANDIFITYSCDIKDGGGTFRYTGGRLQLALQKNWMPITSESYAEEMIPSDLSGNLLKGRTLEAWQWTTFDERNVPSRLNVVFEVAGKPTQGLVLSYEHWSHKPFSEEVFYISAIGLPEPEFQAKLGKDFLLRWMVMLNIAAIVLIAFGFFIWKVTKKRSL